MNTDDKLIKEKRATLNADGSTTPCDMNHDNNMFKKHGPKMKPIINEIFDEINKIYSKVQAKEGYGQFYGIILSLGLKIEEIEKHLKRLNYRLNKIVNENQITPTSKLMLETFHEYFKED